ncbi:MAG: Uma2 family endonuclease, partial [Planctomycetes bacterium]|nr:Uma2 family endonuclease [Planctomycetota bacterium]
YWIIDPERREMTFYRLHDGRFVAVEPVGDRLASAALPGFELDLERVRRTFPA